MTDLNYFSTTRPDSLASPMTNVQTSVVLTDGSTFPDPAQNGGVPYSIIVGFGTDREEICTVTAKPTGSTLTVIRGQDNTPATVKNSGDTVVHGVSARDFKAIVTKVDKAGDTMTGPLILSDDPVDPMGAVTKQAMEAADAQVAGDLGAELALKAPLDSPALTGNPTAPTPAQGDSDTSIATTAYVNAEIAADAPTKTGGGASGTWPIGVSGNAATADKLKTTRNIGLTGDASGSVNFDGSANVAISVVVADDSHNHVVGNVDGLQSALDGKAALSHGHGYNEIRTINLGSIAPGDEVTSGAQTKASDQVVFGANVIAPSSTYLLPVCFVDSATQWRVKVRNTTSGTTHTNVTVYVLLVRPG